MKTRIVSHCTVLLAALGLIAGAAVAQAQNQSNQPSDQQTTTHQQTTHQQTSSHQQANQHQQANERAAQSRPETSTRSETAKRNSVQTQHRSAETARTRAEHTPARRRVASADQATLIARYRHEHPRAAARCRDGFFTNTTNRKFACSKHGGIELWLLR